MLPFAFWKPSVAADPLAALPLSVYVRLGNISVFPTPANFGNGVNVWQGRPSAGVSANHDLYTAVSKPAILTGPMLDGNPVANFRAVGGMFNAPFRCCDADAGVRVGDPAAAPVFTNAQAQGVLASAQGTMFAMVNIHTIVGGGAFFTDDSIWQANLRPGILAGGGNAEMFSANFPFGGNEATIAAVVLDAWCVLTIRWTGGTMEGRLNKGAWASMAIGALSDQILAAGLGGSQPASDMYAASLGAALVNLNDASCDVIYNGLKSLFPSAALP